MSYTRYFAKEAFDSGWTLASQAPLLMEVVSTMRNDANLPPSDAWPMATFTLTVRHLLANVAAKTRGFKEFTYAQVAEAIHVSGYLRLEYVRGKLVLPEQAA
jgi:hypothetical protein